MEIVTLPQPVKLDVAVVGFFAPSPAARADRDNVAFKAFPFAGVTVFVIMLSH